MRGFKPDPQGHRYVVSLSRDQIVVTDDSGEASYLDRKRAIAIGKDGATVPVVKDGIPERTPASVLEAVAVAAEYGLSLRTATGEEFRVYREVRG